MWSVPQPRKGFRGWRAPSAGLSGDGSSRRACGSTVTPTSGWVGSIRSADRPFLHGLTEQLPLIEAGADASALGWEGETVLHRAARGGSAEVVSFLLGAGADVHAVQGGGSTPLHEAARSNPDPAVTQLLLGAGADVHVVGSGIQASTGWGPSTPLHLAASSNPEATVLTVLLAAGADPNARTEPDGWTPLHMAAAQTGNPSVIRILVAAGADIGARTDTGTTPLHFAARNNPHVVPLLLDIGADPSASDDGGTTVLTLMKRNKSLRGLPVVGPSRSLPPASSRR